MLLFVEVFVLLLQALPSK
uniref:Uncharacterized protein n=1 Tax=Rhizophora mucronata TaxID=61149 RepID=A0A2P2PGR9_RHIMU